VKASASVVVPVNYCVRVYMYNPYADRECPKAMLHNDRREKVKVKCKVTIIYIAVLHNRGLLQDRFTIPP